MPGLPRQWYERILVAAAVDGCTEGQCHCGQRLDCRHGLLRHISRTRAVAKQSACPSYQLGLMILPLIVPVSISGVSSNGNVEKRRYIHLGHVDNIGLGLRAADRR